VGTLRELLQVGRSALAGRGIDSPGREATRLLGLLTGLSEAALLAADDRAAAPELEQRYRILVTRRAGGEPMAYLVGHREFFGRRFGVDRHVLIPRPETEHLVEIALGLPLPEGAWVLDVGTGSGAIAVTLAAERPGWRLVATDRSLGALALARANAVRHGVGARVSALAADLLAGLDLGRFDLLVSNPPYVDPAELAGLPRDVRDWEPVAALVSPGGGTRVAERLLAEAKALAPGAFVALEHGASQRAELLAAAQRLGGYELVEARADLAGLARDVVFRRTG
jgi:release factor glutamine methyltransferase